MIISGYQGIGKTTLSVKDDKVIDLESSCYFVDGVRPEGWHVTYCNTAFSLHQQGYTVFVSSHQIVRDYLSRICEMKDLALIYPSRSIKEEWITKLRNRYNLTQLNKDWKALRNAEIDFEQNIDDLSTQSGFQKVEIQSTDYLLESICNFIVSGLCFRSLEENCSSVYKWEGQ